MGKAKKRIIPVGDGRSIEVSEEGLFAPPPAPPAPKEKKKRHGRPKAKTPVHKLKPVSEGGLPQRRGTGKPQGFHQYLDVIPGYREWMRMRRAQINQFRNKMGFPSWKTRRGIPDGMRREEAEALWVIARKKAKEDMANIKQVMTIEDGRAEEALLATLEVMRSPMNQATKLTAARQVLEWTRAKPAAKSEVTVNAAEAWLAQIADEAVAKDAE